MIKFLNSTIAFGLSTCFIISCDTNQDKTKENVVKREVVLDTVFANRLFDLNKDELTGADGAISVDLKDGRSLFLWGDSFFGSVVNDTRQAPVAFMMGNVFTTISDKEVKHHYNGTKTSPSSVIIPDNTVHEHEWYWPGNGFTRDNTLFMFMSKFYKTSSDLFGFEYIDCDLFALNKENFEIKRKTNIPEAKASDIHFGHAVVDEGKYVYVYGAKSINEKFEANVHVARCEVSEDQLINFEFWDGVKWGKDVHQSASINGQIEAVSEQFSVFKYGDDYILLSQDRYKKPKRIYTYTSKNPEGPFVNRRLIYTVDEPNFEVDNMFTYNAMAHPQHIKDNKLLVSYNVNTMDQQKIWVKASLYIPRFFWVPMELIVDNKD